MPGREYRDKDADEQLVSTHRMFSWCSFFRLLRPAGGRPEIAHRRKKVFPSLKLTKVFEIDLYGRWCLPCAGGVVCCEILDRQNREYRFMLFDYSGVRLKERRVLAGQGPDEIEGGNMNTVWLSSSGKIRLLDVGDSLKEMNPETLEIETIVKLSDIRRGLWKPLYDRARLGIFG